MCVLDTLNLGFGFGVGLTYRITVILGDGVEEAVQKRVENFYAIKGSAA